MLDTGRVLIGLLHEPERRLMDRDALAIQRLLLAESSLVQDEAAVTLACLDLID